MGKQVACAPGFGPGELLPDVKPIIEQRLGKDLLPLRLKRERRREKRTVTIIRPHMHPQNARLITPFVDASLRALSLRERARNAFYDVTLTHHAASLAKLPPDAPPLRILHLSDLHLDMAPRLAERTAAQIRGLELDACVITGDIRSSLFAPLEPLLDLLQELLAPLNCPVYASLGNHDLLNMVLPLEQRGIRVLLNEHILLRNPPYAVVLAGIDDPAIYRTHDLHRALPPEPSPEPVVLMAHSPCIWKEAMANGVDFVMAGHTHGGQICLPNGTPIITNDSAPRRFASGAWNCGYTQGYTSRGIGGSSLEARLNCQPHAILHTLTPS
jgi:predicted MPP superfamily phosphohydrolase